MVRRGSLSLSLSPSLFLPLLHCRTRARDPSFPVPLALSLERAWWFEKERKM